MFGDDPLNKEGISPEERQFAFNHKGKWARFWIVFGGPLANFILAFFLFWGLLFFGEKVPEAKLGTISAESKLYALGLRSGDVFKMVNNKNVLGFTDMGIEGERLKTVVVSRAGNNIELSLDLSFEDFFENLGSQDGYLRAPVLQDRYGKNYFLSRSATELDRNFSLEEFSESGLTNLYLIPIEKRAEEYVKLENSLPLDFVIKTNFYEQLNQLALYPMDMIIKRVNSGSPAEKVGIEAGDIVVEIDGLRLKSFEELRKKVQSVPEGSSVNLVILRKELVKTFTLFPESKDDGKVIVKTLGIFSSGEMAQMNYIKSSPKTVWGCFLLAFPRTWDAIVKTAVGFKNLFTGLTSAKNIGGPIAIAKVASDSFNISITFFLGIMALVSVNLGLINLFPIPVLDGGHILFIGIELIMRRPLSRKVMEVAQQGGFSLLMLMIIAAIWNDITRYFS
jgi:regulator of sigma E protease